MHFANSNDALVPNALQFTVEGSQYKWDNQYITGLQIKQLANLPLESELYLSISDPWKDEWIQDNEQVDLARPGLEQFFIKKALRYTINAKEYESMKQYIKGAEIRKQGNISDNHQIFLHIKGPWDDELIQDDTWVDLARPGIEHFYSKAKHVAVIIIVNGREKPYTNEVITYDQVVVLAFPGTTANPNTVYTVTYAKGPEQNLEGSMVKGDQVFIKNKMVFNVTATNKS